MDQLKATNEQIQKVLKKVKKQKTDPSEYNDRTRDRSLDEDETEE